MRAEFQVLKAKPKIQVVLTRQSVCAGDSRVADALRPYPGLFSGHPSGVSTFRKDERRPGERQVMREQSLVP
jgi:hypothetical protein